MSAGGTAAKNPASPARPKLTSRAAVLAVVLCAIALSLAYPVREYIAERRQIDQLQAQNAQISAQVKALKAQQRELGSASYIEQQARDKLHMCFPDQTCYVVVDPASKSAAATGPGQSAAGSSGTGLSTTPWFSRLWDSVKAADRPAAR